MKQTKESKAVTKINSALGGIEVIGKGMSKGWPLSESYYKETGKRVVKYTKMIKSAVKSLGLKVF